MESPTTDIGFVLNGKPVRVGGIAPQTTLLDYIRSRGLTGAKEGCAEGECGACAVLFVQDGAHGATYRPVNSCLVPLPAAAGQEVYTVEALAEAGELAAVQRAMIDRGGSQCGYCTPGFIVGMFAEHYRRERRPADVHALGGNLCRCTGYRPIKDALESLGPPPAGAFLSRLERPAPTISPMRYEDAGGRFSRPCSLAACLELAADDPEAQFVAGNSDLGVATNLRGQRFAHLISLEGIPELREFRDDAHAVEIGAALTLTEIGEQWSDAPGIFREWLPLFASLPLRNRATLGGNLATASPIGDSAPMLLALDAEVRIAGTSGERTVALYEFFSDYRRTALGRGEIVRSVRIPKPWPDDARFYKVAKRSLDDISTVAAGIAVSRLEDGRIRAIRIAFGSVAATPVRAFAAEQALTGTYGEEADLERARETLRRALRPISDHRGSADYRIAMAQSLLDKFWWETGERAAA